MSKVMMSIYVEFFHSYRELKEIFNTSIRDHSKWAAQIGSVY